MKIVLFGASGKVGRIVLQELLSRGHEVVAFTRSALRYDGPVGRLDYVLGDVFDAAAVAEAIQNTDCVVSTLGSWGTATQDVLSRGTEHIIAGMQQHGVNRIVTLTGSDAWLKGEDNGLMRRMLHQFFSLIAPKIIQDGERHMAILQASRTDWTVVRSPVMSRWGGPNYRLLAKPPGMISVVPRRAVAQAMADLAEQQAWVRQAPFIYRG